MTGVLEQKVPKRPDDDDFDPVDMLKAEASAIVREELGLAATVGIGLAFVVGLVADL